jgi:hypothetical protein
MKRYAALIDAPLRCGVRLVAVRQAPGADRLLVDTEQRTLEAVNVVVAMPVFNEAGEPLPLFPRAQAYTLLELGAPGRRRYRCRISRGTHRRTVDGKYKLDEMITRGVGLDELNGAFEAVVAGEVKRSVVVCR